ncbi:MAG: hypothetical protein LAT75_13135 [Candidatus Cyclonatronum sp.]|uniref:hypothetical protein n=1 Tax=Cyclonatronum sp. TaxID=3024185 RepID=UPI0025C1CBA3|nr:hypothetical protein [Cyclonatronum sp.]MCH8487807.1 hypothetical protein [Cyclonatronum sp.]
MTIKRFALINLCVAAILSVPLIAMQFDSGVAWDAHDFVMMSILLLTTAFSLELIFRKMKNKRYRALSMASVILLLLLIWAELAVGIFH